MKGSAMFVAGIPLWPDCGGGNVVIWQCEDGGQHFIITPTEDRKKAVELAEDVNRYEDFGPIRIGPHALPLPPKVIVTPK